jgi:hypothetical protein
MPKYRINFYREYFDNRREARRRIRRTATLSALLAVDAALVALIVVNAFLLASRARTLREGVGRIASRVEEISKPRPELEVAKQLAEVRRSRIDWSPKLAGLSRGIGPSLILVGVRCQVAMGSKPARMEVVGQSRSGVSDMDAVSRFTDALRSDPGFRSGLANVRLGNLGGDQSSRFQIVCEAPGGGS